MDHVEGLVLILLYLSLSGSREKLSIGSPQLLTALNDWTYSLDQGYPTDVIYFDFRKTFDMVPHGRLLLKLKEYGINGNLLCWLSGFLSNRKQHVSINGSFSQLSDVTSGVPQGSVLGPFLFTVYVNDLPSCVNSSLLMILNSFIADNTKLSFVSCYIC